MRRGIRVATVLIALLCAIAGGLVLAGPARAVSPTHEQGFVDKINQERTSRGLRPLILDLQIRDVARGWSGYMASSGDFRHNPNYVAGYPAGWSRAAENIAFGSGSNATVNHLHNGLMNSQGHKDNILGDFTRVGVGVTFDASGGMYVTQNFGKYTNDPVPSPTTTTTAPSTTSTTAPTSSSITLTVTTGTYKSGTRSKANLKWSGATGSKVDVWRNNTKIKTTGNDGAWTDKYDVKLAAGTVQTYKVCRAATTTCSPTRSVTF